MSNNQRFLDIFPKKNNLFYGEVLNNLVFEIGNSKIFEYFFDQARLIIEKADSCKNSCLDDVVRGFVMTPENKRTDFCDLVDEVRNKDKKTVRENINAFLYDSSKNEMPDLIEKLGDLKYNESLLENKFEVIKSPELLRKYSEEVDSCLYSKDDFSFDRAVSDPGTIYLGMENEDGNKSYLRAWVLRSNADEGAIFTDAIISKDEKNVNKQYCAAALLDIGKSLNVSIYDSSDRILSNGLGRVRLPKKVLSEDMFKLGHVPEIRVDANVMNSKDDDYSLLYKPSD